MYEELVEDEVFSSADFDYIYAVGANVAKREMECG
jgi:hypothetical protein